MNQPRTADWGGAARGIPFWRTNTPRGRDASPCDGADRPPTAPSAPGYLRPDTCETPSGGGAAHTSLTEDVWAASGGIGEVIGDDCDLEFTATGRPVTRTGGQTAADHPVSRQPRQRGRTADSAAGGRAARWRLFGW